MADDVSEEVMDKSVHPTSSNGHPQEKNAELSVYEASSDVCCDNTQKEADSHAKEAGSHSSATSVKKSPDRQPVEGVCMDQSSADQSIMKWAPSGSGSAKQTSPEGDATEQPASAGGPTIKAPSVTVDDGVTDSKVPDSYNIWEDENPLVCGICTMSFSSTKELLIHFLTHVDVTCKEHLPLHKTKLCFYNNKYQCHNCKLKTRYRLMFREHVRHHVLRLPYSCGVCSKEMMSLVEWKSHVASSACEATANDVVMKPTEIVRQVMNMLGPKAPATEHLYSVKVCCTNKAKQLTMKGKGTGQVSPSRSESEMHVATSSTIEAPPTGTAPAYVNTTTVEVQHPSEVAIKRSRDGATDVSTSCHKLPSDDGQTEDVTKMGTTGDVVADEPSGSKLPLSSDQNIFLKNKPTVEDDDGSKDTSTTKESSVDDLTWRPLILEVTSGENIPKPVSPSVINQQELSTDDGVTVGNVVIASVERDQNSAVQSSDMDAIQTEICTTRPSLVTPVCQPTVDNGVGSQGIQLGALKPGEPVEILNVQSAEMGVSQTGLVQSGLSVTGTVSASCSKLCGLGSNDSMTADRQDIQSSSGQPILVEDDDIQVVQVSHPQSAPREDSQIIVSQEELSEGKSAEHPIVINDDDLHQATNSNQNKIKIERKPNGIVLRLFQDKNGELEDLSQLGLEVRKDMWYCCRCECSFANWQDFLPHVSDELHTIFNFHTGLCPVCKHSVKRSGREAMPCKLARILLRVLSVVYRSIEKSKAAAQDQGLSPESQAAMAVIQGSYTSCPVINIAPQASFQTKPTTITMPQTSTVFTVMGGPSVQVPASTQDPGATVSAIPSPSPIVIMPQDPVSVPANQGSGQSSVLIIPVQQASMLPPKSTGQIITPIVIAPTPVVSANTQQVTGPLLTVSGAAPSSEAGGLRPQQALFQQGAASPAARTVSICPTFPTSEQEGHPENIQQGTSHVKQEAVGQVIQEQDPLGDQNLIVATRSPSPVAKFISVPVSLSLVPTTASPVQTKLNPTQGQFGAIQTTVGLVQTRASPVQKSQVMEGVTETDERISASPDAVDILSKNTTVAGPLVGSLGHKVQAQVKPHASPHSDDPPLVEQTAVPEADAAMSCLGQSLSVVNSDGLATGDQLVDEQSTKCARSGLVTDEQEGHSSKCVSQESGSVVIQSTDSGPVRMDQRQNGTVMSNERKMDDSLMKAACSSETSQKKTDGDVELAKTQKPGASPSLASKDQEMATIMSQLPRIAPRPSGGEHSKTGGRALRVAAAISRRKLCRVRRAMLNKRQFVGEFLYHNKRFVCVSCKFQHRSENVFRRHLSKHVHGKLNSKFCNHCPPHVVYDRLSHCPLLKQMITFMKLAARMRSLRKQREHSKNEASDLDETLPADDGQPKDTPPPSSDDANRPTSETNSPDDGKCLMVVSEVSTRENIKRHAGCDDATDKAVSMQNSADSSLKKKDSSDVETNEHSGTEEVTCSRLKPYEKRVACLSKKELEQKLFGQMPTDTGQSGALKLSIKCAVGDCDFRAIYEDEFRLHNYVKHADSTTFPCSYCSKAFGDVEKLLGHLDGHRDWVYKCTFAHCNFGARKLPEYESHLSEHHGDAEKYKCCFCSVQAGSIPAVISHIELHVRIQIKCPYCEKTSTEKKHIQAHIAEVHSDQPKKVVVSTQIIPNLDEQVQPVAAIDQAQKVAPSVSRPKDYVPYPKTTCEKCSFVSLSQDQFDGHMRLHDSKQDREKNFFCRQCPFSCESLDDYRLHVQQHANTSTMRIYMCAHCTFCTMHMSKIEDHLADEHAEKPFKFEVLQEKVNHMQLMQACGICGELVLNTDERYMKEHHAKCHGTATPASQVSSSKSGVVVVERYHCDMCQYSTHSETDLASHLKQVHHIQHKGQAKDIRVVPVPSADQAPSSQKGTTTLYECDLCSYKTANKKMFIDHHRQHAEGVGQTSYKCEFCPYESTKYKNLVSHQKVHSRPVEEGFKCAYCFYMNTIKSRVSWHISAYHPGKEKKIVEINNGTVTSTTSVPKKSKQSPKSDQTSPHRPAKEPTSVTAPADRPIELAVGSLPAQTTTSPVAQILDDEDLKDFERNLPADAIFKHPVYCPFCHFSNQVRQTMLQHLKSHVKTKSGQSQDAIPSVSKLPTSQPPVSKSLLTFFKRSTEISVFRCCLCEYVHVNGSDMVRHFLCEHVTMGCSLCQHHTSTTGRMREHFAAEHRGQPLSTYLKKADVKYELSEGDFRKIELMERQTMLQELDSDNSHDSDLVDDDHDFDEESAEVLKHCKKLKLNNRLRYRCIYCGYTNGLPLIRRHVLSVHMKFLAFSCKYCKTRCREKYHLQQHIQNVHPGSPVVIHRRRFNPERHGKIVKKTVDNMYRRKRKHSDSDDGRRTAGSESEQSLSLDATSIGCFTPSRESISSMESAVCSTSASILPSTIKQEDADGCHTPKAPRISELRQSGQQLAATDSSDEASGNQKGRRNYYCAYCDYFSQHIKQDIQRHILHKHLQIHVFVCKKCRFSSNNKRNMEQHRKQHKGHTYRDFTDVKDKIVAIHHDGNNVTYGFPEGQLTEIQRDLENIPGLFIRLQAVGEKTDTGSSPSAPDILDHSFDATIPADYDVPASDVSRCTSPSLEQDASCQDELKLGVIGSLKNVEDVGQLKLPKMSVYSCAYCEYTSKYNRGDVKKHILFKHFLNKKYTCGYCNFGSWEEQLMRAHFESAHPSQPENLIDNSFESRCIVPIMKTQRCLTLGIRTPANSTIQLQKNIVHQCKLCSFEAPNMIKLKLHIIVKHWNLKPYQCPVCKDLRWKRHAIREHLKKVHPEVSEGPIVTYIKKSAELMNLVKKKVIFTPVPKSTHTGSPNKMIKCVLCEHVAVSQAKLEEHVKSHRVFSCIYCPFEAGSKSAVQIHIETNHPEYPVRIKTLEPLTLASKPQLPRPVPSGGFMLKKKLIHKVEGNGLKKKFVRKLDSVSHGFSRQMMKAGLSKTYKCNLCGHQVMKLRDILEHLCKHYNYYRFACSYCNVRTIRGYLMKKHLEKKHPDMSPVYNIDTDEQLEAEIRRGYSLTKRAPKRNKECVMFCPLCAKRCGRQSSLREHVMRDLNYRPYICPFCDYCECTGGKVNFHMHQTHKDGSGRYQYRPDADIAARVDKLVEEAKQNAEKKIFPKVTLTRRLSSPSDSPTKRMPLVVKLPKMHLKEMPKVKLDALVKTEPVDGDSQEPPASSSPSVVSERAQSFRFECHMCDYGTNKEKLLKSHLMRSHGTKRWKCFYCDCKAVYRSTIIKHVRDSHKHKTMKVIQILPTSKESYKDEPDVEVVLAPTAYGKAEPQLLSLLKNRPGGGIDLPTVKHPRRLSCSENGDDVAVDKQGIYHCQKCSYNTPNKKHLRMHLLRHKKADLKCFYCNSIYRAKFRLRRHCLMQHKDKPVKWYSVKTGELREESVLPQGPSADSTAVITDVTKSPQTLYCCHMCNACLNTAKELFQHVHDEHSGADSASLSSQHSAGRGEPSDPPQLEADVTAASHCCLFCPFSTDSAAQLEKHSKEHDVRKPFRCSYCGYSCLYRSEAKRHCERKHPGRRMAFIAHNARPSAKGSGGSSASTRPRVMLTNLLSLDDKKLRGLLESNKVKTIHTCDTGSAEESDASSFGTSESSSRSERRQAPGPSRRPRRLECIIDGCGRTFSYSFDVYRHQRTHHNISSDMYQKGVGATFKAFRVLDDDSDSDK